MFRNSLVVGRSLSRLLSGMAAPQPRTLFKADPASLSPEEKKHLITRNLEVRMPHRRPLLYLWLHIEKEEEEEEEEGECSMLSGKSDVVASLLG